MPVTITKAIGDHLRIRCSNGYVLVMDIAKGEEPDTVRLSFTGSGSIILATESLADAKVTWLISPRDNK